MKAVLSASPAETRKLAEFIKCGMKISEKKNDYNDARLITISGTARMLALGRNTIYSLIKTNRLETVELNGCRRITLRSIHQLLDGERPANEQTAVLVGASKARYAASKAKEAQ